MPSVQQNGQLDAAGRPRTQQGGDRRADAAARKQHIIYQYHALAGDIERYTAGCQRGISSGAAAVIIAVKPDVYFTDGHFRVLDTAQQDTPDAPPAGRHVSGCR